MAIIAVACPAGPVDSSLTREQAIEIARSEVSFNPESVEVELLASREMPVWRVTFRGRLPSQPPGLFETMIVYVDAASGDIVRISRT